MYKTTTKDFILFKKEAAKWLKQLGLEHWNVKYQWENLDEYNLDGGMTMDSNSVGYATLSLDTEIDDCHTPFDIKTTAKHEVMHLLVRRLSEAAYYRYSSKDEIYNAEEELVNRLAHIIK